MRRAILVSVFTLSLFCAIALRAEHTRFWEQSSFEEFDKGTHKGVAIRSDGLLLPAPDFRSFADPNLAYLWALAADSRGRLYAAGGSDARVLRIDASGKATSVFDSSELEAQSLAVDKQDNVYVGTSPDGKVYKITPEGQHTVFFEPKSKYIWALAFDSRGILFVATGDKGEIFAVAPDGKGQVFYKSEETHARSLAFDEHGDLLVGTDPSGLIIRVPLVTKAGSALPTAGKAFVIYETSKKEVTALQTDSSGNIYAAAVGNKSGARPIFAPQPNAASSAQLSAALAAAARSQTGAQAQAAVTPAPAAPMIFPPFPSATGGAEVYKIAPDGSPESLWSSPQDVVYALGFSADGHLLLGTGNQGEVIELDGDKIFSSLASSDASQVTALAAGPNHAIYVASANPGKIFTLGPGYASEGTFESQPFDAKIFSRWGRLTWWGDNSATSGKLEFFTRSGNTSDPDNYWSEWEGPYTNQAGEAVRCPSARFLQWKVVFHNAATGPPPSLSWVKLAYLKKNVPPTIDGIVVERPGYRAQSFPGAAGEQQRAPSAIPFRMPRAIADGESNFQNFSGLQQAPQRFNPAPQGTPAKGFETAVWTADDDNDDQLTFTLYYRGEGEKEWKLLKDDIRDDFYSWDTNSMPDGAYYLKLVASDKDSNPADQALKAELTSDRFSVDNTPPMAENLRAEPAAGGEWRIRFTARDGASAVAKTSYNLDAGDWEVVFPAGELTDAPVENYDILLRNLKPGEHTVAVQVFDEFENSVTAKVTFTVPVSRR
jgi:sugar lactone lactonase YvrE